MSDGSKESAAERLARAYIAHADSVARGMVALRDGSYARAERELDEAEAAYRAAQPDSAGAAPPAAEPAHSCEMHAATKGEHSCGLSPCENAKVHHDMGPPRPAKVYRAGIDPAEPAPRTTTTGAIVSALAQMGLAQLAEPAAQPFPRASWVCAICDGGPANDCACSCPDGGKRAASAPEPSDRPE